VTVATSFEQLVRELRSFDGRREIVKAMRKGVRKPLPAVRKAIKAAAVGTLPHRGGLGLWVASSRVTATVQVSGRKAGVKLKGGRNSARKRSDIAAIDRGTVRAPAWGRRTAASWHTQAVAPGFFTKTAADSKEWAAAVDAEVNRSLDQLRRG
jgi:hypothetical protein